MFGSGMLDVAIGIVFVYVLVSTICSVVREGIEAWFKTRAAYLEYGIRELLHDKSGSGLAQSLFNHPLIFSLYSGDYNAGRSDKRPGPWTSGVGLPSYIPAKNFALALMDIAARGPATDAVSSDPSGPAMSLTTVRRSVLNLQNAAVQRVLLTAIDSAQGDFDQARANLEAWYDSAMDRVSGWYKRSTQWVIFWIAIVFVVSSNINTITIADYLYRNDTARAAIVERAQSAATDTAYLDRTYEQVKQEIESLQLPIGWSDGWGTNRDSTAGRAARRFEVWNDVFAPIIGWLLTALAATLGAPFWFDLLKKIMVIRSTVAPRETTPTPPASDEGRGTPPGVTSGLVPKGTPPGGSAGTAAGAASFEASWTGVALRDADSNRDGCERTTAGEATPDEQLPAAEGGVV